MKKFFTLTLFFALCAISSNAATYLISDKATTSGETISHDGMKFITGQTAFADFSSFLSSSIVENSTVYVASGTYSGNITISTNGLTFLGNNSYSDWTVTRKAESTITGTITIKASKVTINGFKFTEGGRIESSQGINMLQPIMIRFIHLYI